MELTDTGMYYGKTGSGSKTLLLFHGFGQDHRVFDDLTRSISNHYTCYSFDLFFHGHTRRNDAAHPVSPEEWKSLLTAFLQAENIKQFSLLGYSIGARLVLATIPMFSERIKSVYLIAPDGIKDNFWFTMATQYGPTRMLFRKTVTNPGLLTGIIGITSSLKLMHQSILRFARNQMRTQEQRQRIYDTWMMFSKLTANLQVLATKINQSRIEVTLILGKRDRLIPHHETISFIRSIKKGRLVQLDSGHSGLIQAASQESKRIFKAFDESQH